MLKEASTIINAGDADREGQLLIDEVLTYFNNQKPVLPFWVAAHDAISLQRGLSSLKDNAEFVSLGLAAEARSKADWLIGMNLSRAYTLRASRNGTQALVTVGRVQTPTLKLVVDRDKEIESFQAKEFYTIDALIQQEESTFKAHWKPSADQSGLDEKKRLIDICITDALIQKISGQAGAITQYTQEVKTKAHPTAYSLSDLTLIASNRYGYTAQEVLESCQALYETHKLTTYPRTDCRYLPESQLKDAPAIFAALKIVNPEMSALIDKANPAIQSKTWDDKKVTAHFGIIPTLHQGTKANLNEKEHKIYELIVRNYLAQFYPLHEFNATTIELRIADELFTATGSLILHHGWKEVYQIEEKTEEESQVLPPIKQDQAIHCIKATRTNTKTKPSPRFTEGTLQRSMENIYQTISEPEHKKMLKEGDGIGTPATRANIIAELKRRNFLESRGKQLVSTPLGRSIIEALPEMVKSPVLTALYERMLKSIEQDSTHFLTFINKQTQFVVEQVKAANEGGFALKGVKSNVELSSQYSCMLCKQPLCKRKSTKGYWWSCSAYPTCKQTYADLKGRPNYRK